MSSKFYLMMIFLFLGCTKKTTMTLDDIKKLSQNHALVVAYNDGTVRSYDDKGIKPLFRHIAGFKDFKDAYVFDKVTGKASALILAYGKASRLYTGILSKDAIPVLEKYKIEYFADKIVDYILNDTGEDMCPMEKTVVEVSEPKEAYIVLKERFNN